MELQLIPPEFERLNLGRVAAVLCDLYYKMIGRLFESIQINRTIRHSPESHRATNTSSNNYPPFISISRLIFPSMFFRLRIDSMVSRVWIKWQLQMASCGIVL